MEEHLIVPLARKAIEEFVRYRIRIPPPSELSPEMKKRAGVFVSIKKRGELRGCIGTITPEKDNLASEIISNAIDASSGDPRFPPMGPDELNEISISVDVLGEAEPISSTAQLDPKRYGVIVESGPEKGVLLPNLEGVDTAGHQVEIAKRKAGIGPYERCNMYRFEVVRYR